MSLVDDKKRDSIERALNRMMTNDSTVLKRFKKDILRRATRLTHEEQAELHRRYIEDGDIEARDALVDSMLMFVWFIAYRMHNGEVDIEDMISAGYIGLLKAFKGWDPDKGALSTYSSWWIRESIQSDVWYTLRNVVTVPAWTASTVTMSSISINKIEEDTGSPMDHILGFVDPEVDLEREALENDTIVWSLLQEAGLNDRELEAVIRAHGLLGYEVESGQDIANSWGTARGVVNNFRRRGLEKLAARFTKGELIEALAVPNVDRQVKAYGTPHELFGDLPQYRSEYGKAARARQ